MNPLAAIRKHRRPLVVQLLGMLGVVWFGMVLQPCVMAADMDMDMDGPCPHCPQPMDPDCDAGMTTSCRYFDHVDYDGRGAHVSLPKKTLEHLAVAVAERPVEREMPARATGPPRNPLVKHSDPPLNVLYCVYLI